VPADSGEGEGADDEGCLVGVVGGVHGSGVYDRVVLGAAEGDAGVAQGLELDDTAAGFGEEVAGEAEAVDPAA
jgi:hypothetical protein